MQSVLTIPNDPAYMDMAVALGFTGVGSYQTPTMPTDGHQTTAFIRGCHGRNLLAFPTLRNDVTGRDFAMSAGIAAAIDERYKPALWHIEGLGSERRAIAVAELGHDRCCFYRSEITPYETYAPNISDAWFRRVLSDDENAQGVDVWDFNGLDRPYRFDRAPTLIGYDAMKSHLDEAPAWSMLWIYVHGARSESDAGGSSRAYFAATRDDILTQYAMAQALGVDAVGVFAGHKALQGASGERTSPITAWRPDLCEWLKEANQLVGARK